MPLEKNQTKEFKVTGMTIVLCQDATFFIDGRFINVGAKIQILGATKKPIEIPIKAIAPVLAEMEANPEFRAVYQSLVQTSTNPNA